MSWSSTDTVAQVNYALDEIVYPRDKLRICLVYNTPKPIEPLETELLEMEAANPILRVIKVIGSKSKADNLNFFFTLDTGADITAIFDCDHFPHPHNPRWAAERFISDPTVDIVQGRCVVYNTDETWFTKMIAIEFDKIYAVSHPGRSRLFGFGLFCGSNGYWKTELLRPHKMHGHMLCEDIDSALRAYGKGRRAVHDMNVKSVCITRALRGLCFPFSDMPPVRDGTHLLGRFLETENAMGTRLDTSKSLVRAGSGESRLILAGEYPSHVYDLEESS